MPGTAGGEAQEILGRIAVNAQLMHWIAARDAGARHDGENPQGGTSYCLTRAGLSAQTATIRLMLSDASHQRMTQAIASGRPAYELRSHQRGPSDLELEMWRCWAPATPELKGPRRVTGLGGHKLLVPMRNVASIETCARGIDAMAREEAAYWLGMAMHRKNPRRVLAALRLLLSANS